MATTFAACYAVALLFHNQKDYVERDWNAAALMTSALTTIVWPDVAPFLVSACLLQTVQFWNRLPTAQTSEYLKALCSVCLIATYIPLAIEAGGPFVDAQQWYSRYAPLLRLLLCMMLLASVLHKTNWAFLRHDTSAAPHFLYVVLEHIGLRVSSRGAASLSLLMPVMTLAVEGGVAVLLSYPPTRSVGVLVALAFWTVIAAQGITQFSSLMFALMVPFLSVEAVTVLDADAAVRGLQVACVVYFLYATYAKALIGSPATLLTLLGVFGTTYLLAGIAAGRILTVQDSIVRFSAGHVILIAAFWLNELGPYIGFKDWPAFRMYSNLETGAHHNHLFMPRWLHVDRLRCRLLVLTGATLDMFYDATSFSYPTQTTTPPYVGRADEEFAVTRADLRSLAASTMRLRRGAADTPIQYRDGEEMVTTTMRELATTGRCSWRPVSLSRFFVFRPRPCQTAARSTESALAVIEPLSSTALRANAGTAATGITIPGDAAR